MDVKDIKSPQDIKGLSLTELEDVAGQLRKYLLVKLGARGGHVGPNLGVVEATLALHYVFDAPTDKIVFDVSHQSYVHKMLTGRIDAFIDPAKYDDVSGYTSPAESPEYDLFEVGHTSTAMSLASGLQKARDLKGDDYSVVAFIGDGSLSGGQAFEGFDYVGETDTNFVAIVNDNQMSIAEDHGGLYKALKKLRDTNGQTPDNIFKAIGFEYIYVNYGNDLKSLIEAFRSAKDSKRPIVVHINTMKGQGLPCAEAHKEQFHWTFPFDLKTGAPLRVNESEAYNDIFARYMLERMHGDRMVTAITAATPGVLGFTPERRAAAGEQFIDVGIAEEQATAMASGLAKAGARPVFGVASTFVERAYDQLLQDVSINRNPAVFVVFATGVYGILDVTHLGIWDIPMFSSIPELPYLAPVCKEEYLAMLKWAIDQHETPVAIRTPGGPVVSMPGDYKADYSNVGFKVVQQGNDVALIGVGPMFQTMLKAAEILKDKGIDATVINPRIVSRVDAACLDSLKDYRLIITAEDSSVEGGFGQKVATYMSQYRVPVRVLGLPQKFIDRYNAADVLRENSLTPEQIVEISIATDK